MIPLYGEIRFYRHVASHWIEMQQALIAMIIGGVFEFHPKLRAGFLEAQNSSVPGLLNRIEWDYPQYHDSHASYLSLTATAGPPARAVSRRSRPRRGSSAPTGCASPRTIRNFDSNFTHASENLLKNVPREIAAQILTRGPHLYGRRGAEFEKADAAAAKRRHPGQPLAS